MFKGLKVLIVVGALLVLAAAVFRLYGVRSATAAGSFANVPTQTTTADRGDIPLTIITTGNIQAIQNVSLGFAVSGTVSTVNVKAGDYVLKGQTIATVDDQSALDAVATAQDKVNTLQLALEKLTAKPRQVDIDVAQANVNLAQATLNEAQISPTDSIQIKIAQLNIELAKNQLWQAQLARDITNQKATKTRPLNSTTIDANNKAISAATLGVTVAQDQLNATQSTGANPGSIDAAKASLLSAQQQLQTLLSGPDPNDVKQAQDNLAAAQEALAAAKLAVTNTNLLAPFDGLVAQVNLNVGQTATSAQDSTTTTLTAAVILLDVSKFYVDVPVAELDIAKIKVGQAVNLNFDALPGRTLSGQVTQVAETPNTGTPVTYTVRIVFSPAELPLLSTMSTTAYIVYQNTPNVIRLPNGFIRQNTTTNQAFASVRQSDGTFQNVPIQLGAANDTYTEITSGLNAGDVVAAPTVAGSGGRTGAGGFGGGPGGAGGLLRGLGG